MKQICNLTLQCKTGRFASILAFILLLGSQSFTYAQPCDLLANFSFTVSDCDVTFQPYSNGSGIAHFWTFNTTGLGFTSSSNLATPVHTFGATTSPFLRTVTHSVTIGGVIYTCTKQIYVVCTTGCDDREFSYSVNGCSVTFFSPRPGQNWNFGDGNSTSQINPTHTYTADGDYLITFNIPGTDIICRKTIRVACGSTQTCCTAAFTGEVKRECSKLVLSLNAECTGNGTHLWTITPNVPNACMTLSNFFKESLCRA
ncbi:MAG: PKD domain-containing protein [Saprospiraceae bacterium]